MKPMNKHERWYVFLWVLVKEDRDLFDAIKTPGGLHTVGRLFTDGERHSDLQKYGKALHSMMPGIASKVNYD